MSYRKAKLLLEKTKKKKQQQQPLQQEQEEIEVKQKNNAFSMLANSDSDNEKQQQKNQQTNEQKGLEKAQENEQSEAKKKKRKNKKKKKGPNHISQQQERQNIQERQFKKALKEVGMQIPDFGKKDENGEQDSWKNIFQISEKKFDYEKQLRRHFKGWNEDKKEDNEQMPRKQQKLQKHLRKMMKRSILAPGVREYFPTNEKFQVQNEDESIKFIPTKKYLQYQAQYQAVRNSNDVNALFQFSQTHPQHVDSLYSIGQFLRLQGNYRQADALIQRVIYIYQISGGYLIGQFIKNDYCSKRVVYETYSTSLFMSLFKMMDILGKKGCFKAALEYNKFLLKLNLDDPTACLLCLDFNAISSKQYQFLLQFQSEYSKYQEFVDSFKTKESQIKSEKNIKGIQLKKQENKKIKKSLYFLPNFIYSSALAKFMIHNSTAKNENKDLIINQSNIQQLLQFKSQHWEKAINISNQVDFMCEQPQILILRAIILYPRLIIDIASTNQFSKKFVNHPCFKEHQKKTFPQIMQHSFWKMAPQSYSYHFLKLDSINDSKGLDKILEIYVERSKILWKSNQVVLWLKGAMGFVLNQIQRTQFNYEEFLINLCAEGSVDFQIPFNLKRYQGIFKGNFSDRVERIDMNNIQDNQGAQQQPVGNPINVEGNPLALFLNSLLPWVNLPNVNNQAEDYDPDMPFIQEDQN